MSHPALEIDNWVKVNPTNVEKWVKVQANDKQNNPGVRFDALDIDASKFYFYLKDRFGSPNQNYMNVSRFFQKRDFTTGMEWSYLLETKEKDNYIIISGDNKINVFVFSLNDSPSGFDFHIFSENVKVLLENYSLDSEQYLDLRIGIFINYSFYLKKLITDLKQKVELQIGALDTELHIDHKDISSENPEVQASYLDLSYDYNDWLKKVIEKSIASLEIQILYPIYFESLVDLAFRVMLKINFYEDKSIKYTYREKEYDDIFQYFSILSRSEKIKEIEEKCGRVNMNKVKEFSSHFKSSYWTNERNKLLHGNSVYFHYSNSKIYVDESHLVGLPDKFDLQKMIADSIQNTTKEVNIIKMITFYESLCDVFVDIFDDDGSFKSLVSGIAFGYNKRKGGCISFPDINKFEDLLAPLEWKSNNIN